MREIKFRYWKAETEKMISGNDLAFEEYLPITDLLTQEEIMQYTGLKDKNNIEIYEGDIIKVLDSDKNYQIQEVVFKDGAFCGYSDKKTCKYTFLEVIIKAHGLGVIGNIYENKELLVRCRYE